MAYSKSTMKAVNQYVRRKYDRLSITVPKGRKNDIEACARMQGISINCLVNQLLREAVGMSEMDWKIGEKNENL